MNSGSLFSPWAMIRSGLAASRAKKSGELLGCNSEESEEMLRCLRNKSVGDIMKIRKFFVEWDTDPFVVFGPVIEDRRGFFTQEDLNRKTTIDLLTGVSLQEGVIKVSALLSRSFDYITQLMTEFEQWAPLTFGYGQVGDFVDLSTSVQGHYFNGLDENFKADISFFRNLTQAYTDSWFSSGYRRTLKDHHGKSFRYRLDRKPMVSLVNAIGGKYPEGVVGASHGDDMLYLFNLTNTLPFDPLNFEDKKISEIMVRLWSNFVINGSPGGIWKETSNEDTLVFASDGTLTMSDESEMDYSYELWHNIENQVQRRNELVRTNRLNRNILIPLNH